MAKIIRELSQIILTKKTQGTSSEVNLRTDNQNPSGDKVAFQGIKTLTLLRPNLKFRLGLAKSALGQRYRTNNTFVTSSGLLRMPLVNLAPNHVLSLYLFLPTKQMNKIFLMHWRYSFLVKNASSYCIGPEFLPQYPHVVIQPYIIPFLGDSVSSLNSASITKTLGPQTKSAKKINKWFF